MRTSTRRRSLSVLLRLFATVFPFSPSALAERELFFEETASAFWAVPYECPSGEIVQGTLLIESTRDFSAPDTDDPNPTARVQFQAVCPSGSSVNWRGIVPATITSTENLKSVTVSGSGSVTDLFSGAIHQVSFEVVWTATGPLETTVNSPGSMRKQRTATATGFVTLDGEILVDGEANHPTRPTPFIRVDTET